MGSTPPYIFPPENSGANNSANQAFRQYSGANTRPLSQQNTQPTGYGAPAQNNLPKGSAAPEPWNIPGANDPQSASYKEYTPFGQSEQKSGRQSRKHKSSFRLPLQHLLLAAGISMIYVSLAQPWGYGANGKLIFLNNTLVRAGTIDVAVFAALAALLILLHSRMGCFAMLGCLGLFLLPSVAIVAIGSIAIYTQMHAFPVLSEANALKPAYRGLYLGIGGAITIAAALLLETLTRRKKGFLGLP